MTTTFRDRTYFMEPGHPQWAAAWEQLAADPVNKEMHDKYTATCPRSGESWEYMGSYRKPDVFLHSLRCWHVHEFRHRHHPTAGGRVLKRAFIRSVPCWGE
jgi:hypothetical protein